MVRCLLTRRSGPATTPLTPSSRRPAPESMSRGETLHKDRATHVLFGKRVILTENISKKDNIDFFRLG
jgi:hypothetical protein